MAAVDFDQKFKEDATLQTLRKLFIAFRLLIFPLGVARMSARKYWHDLPHEHVTINPLRCCTIFEKSQRLIGNAVIP